MSQETTRDVEKCYIRKLTSLDFCCRLLGYVFQCMETKFSERNLVPILLAEW